MTGVQTCALPICFPVTIGRSFRYHDLLGEIVCPLELDVLQSGLSWVDYTKDVKLVLDCKIDNYQRGIFLHPDRAELLLSSSRPNVIPTL